MAIRICDMDEHAAKQAAMLFQTHYETQKRRADKLQAEMGRLRELETELIELIAQSTGVAGYHLNGDVAEWGELLPGGRFEWLHHIDQEVSDVH